MKIIGKEIGSINTLQDHSIATNGLINYKYFVMNLMKAKTFTRNRYARGSLHG